MLKKPCKPTHIADDFASARCPTAGTVHGAVVVVEERVVGRQLLAGLDVAHGHQHNVAGKAYVRLARVVEEEHHRLVLVVGQRHEVQVVGDLDLRALEPAGDRPKLLSGNEVAAFDRNDLVFADRLDGKNTATSDLSLASFYGLRCDPRRHHGLILARQRPQRPVSWSSIPVGLQPDLLCTEGLLGSRLAAIRLGAEDDTERRLRSFTMPVATNEPIIVCQVQCRVRST